MRTSFELSDALLDRARKLAKRRGTTLRAVLEEALRRFLAEGDAPQPFRLRDVTFGEAGLTEGLSEHDWERIRELAYEGRGS
jgi:predicted transcriptional regulator